MIPPLRHGGCEPEGSQSSVASLGLIQNSPAVVIAGNIATLAESGMGLKRVSIKIYSDLMSRHDPTGSAP